MGNRMIVCYTGGTCGDLIGKLIDPLCGTFKGTTIEIDPIIAKLKKPHLFADDDEKDKYVAESHPVIISHDLEYHIRKLHPILGIRVSDKKVALWAAERFKALHRPHVWEEMQRRCGASTVEEYAEMLINFGNLLASYTTDVLSLEDIIAGKAISRIEELLDISLPEESTLTYNKWLTLNGS